MRSVLFIEDRISRQINMLGIIGCENLRKLESLTLSDNPEQVIEQLNAGNPDVLANYSLVIIHKSSINQVGLYTLYDYGKKHDFSIVLFSGGISSVSYIKDKFELLQLSSLELYSLRLINFLKNYIDNKSEHLTELAYGKKWKLNFLFQYRHLLFLQDQNDDLFSEDEERNNITKQDLMINCINILGPSYSMKDTETSAEKVNEIKRIMKDIEKEIKTIMAKL